MICIVLQTNCLNTFIDYIGVTKSLHPAKKCQKEWNIPLTPILAIWGGEALPSGKIRLLASKKKTKNATQPLVERTCNVLWIFIIHKPSSEVHWNIEARISESPDSHLGKSWWVIKGIFWILITGELYHIKATRVDSYFSE
jgi:hypothetical protein